MHELKQSHLRYFVAVAELGGISAAAQRLHRSPSAVSMTLANLESQLGQPLFEADGKSRLTPLGRHVFDIAKEQLKHFDHAMDSIEAFARNDVGRVNIAAVPSFAMHHLPALLADFIARHPRITLSIRDDSSAHINAMVSSGEIDIGIASLIEPAQGLASQPLFTDLMGVVCRPSHPLARLEHRLLWEDLQNYPLIANGTCQLITVPVFKSMLAAAELHVQNTTSLLALVAAGVGVSILPQLAVPPDRGDVVFLPMSYPWLKRTISVITPNDRTLPPAAAALAASLVKQQHLDAQRTR